MLVNSAGRWLRMSWRSAGRVQGGPEEGVVMDELEKKQTQVGKHFRKPEKDRKETGNKVR